MQDQQSKANRIIKVKRIPQKGGTLRINLPDIPPEIKEEIKAESFNILKSKQVGMPLIDFKEDKKEILPKAVSDSKLPLLSTIIPPSQKQVFSQKKQIPKLPPFPTTKAPNRSISMPVITVPIPPPLKLTPKILNPVLSTTPPPAPKLPKLEVSQIETKESVNNHIAYEIRKRKIIIDNDKDDTEEAEYQPGFTHQKVPLFKENSAPVIMFDAGVVLQNVIKSKFN